MCVKTFHLIDTRLFIQSNHKESIAVLGKRQETQILKFNLLPPTPTPPPPPHPHPPPPPPTPPPPPPPHPHPPPTTTTTTTTTTFPESRGVKDYENVKLVHLSSCTAVQLPLILCMISKNSDFGVGGNVKFFTEANFILMNTKLATLNQKIILYLSAFKSSWYMERFFRYDPICVEKLPLVKIRKNKPKIEISLSLLLIIRNIQNLHLDMCFCGWQMRWN